jgi:hypothetical protein
VIVLRGYFGLLLGTLMVACAAPFALVVLLMSLIGWLTLADARTLFRRRPRPAPVLLPTRMSDAEIWRALAIDYPNVQRRSQR